MFANTKCVRFRDCHIAKKWILIHNTAWNCCYYFLRIDRARVSERQRTLNEYEMKNGFSVMCGHIVDGYTHFWIARQWKIVMKSHFVLCHTNKSIISLFMTLSLAAASTDCSVTYCQYQFAHSNRLNYFELVFIAVGWMNIKKLFYGISKVQFREIDMIGFYQ